MTETTTDAATQDNQGVDTTTQPVEQPAEAVQTADGEPTTTTEPGDSDDVAASADDASDDDLTAWATNKGIDLSTPEGQAKALKSMREAEKKMHETAAKASELKKQFEETPVTTDDERVQRLETLYNVTTWKTENNITPEQDLKMGQYLTDNPVKRDMVLQGLLTFDEVLSLSGASKVDPTQLKREGGKEALETLANKQRATSPTGNASTAVKQKVDPITAALAD